MRTQLRTRQRARIAGSRGLSPCGPLLAVLLAAPVAAGAATVKQIEVFGDSLSDTGNLFAVTSPIPGTMGGIPPSPAYDRGRFSNGPVWVDQLAERYPRAVFNSRAVGGAFTTEISGADNVWDLELGVSVPGVDGLESQIAAYDGPLMDRTAHVVWAGANNLLSADRENTSTGEKQSAVDIVDRSVKGVVDGITALSGKGASNFVVANLPDIGRTPFAVLSGRTDELSEASKAFNVQLAAELAALQLDITLVDIFALFEDTLSDPDQFGFDNTTSPCLMDLATGRSCSTPDTYVYWDDVHPTSAAHAIVGELFASAIQPVPLPGAIWLLVSGLALAAGLGARRRG